MNAASFETWWTAVPRKVGKGAARRAYASALKKTDESTLLSGIARYAREKSATEARFIKHPSTWLNGECWLDEPDEKPRESFPPRLVTCNITGCPEPQHRMGWCRKHCEHFGIEERA